MIPRLETERLILRGWRDADFEPFARMQSDPDVMRFIGGTAERNDAWRAMAGHAGHWVLRGYGKWAVERKSDGALIGNVGMINPEGWPALEIGWTLDKPHWGHGYATEAAQASMGYAFLTQRVERLISCIDSENIASQRVAQRLGETQGAPGNLRMRGQDYAVDIWSISRADWQRRQSAP